LDRTEPERQDRKARTGQKHRTVRTGQPELDRQDKITVNILEYLRNWILDCLILV
jgi:hypothetical protein